MESEEEQQCRLMEWMSEHEGATTAQILKKTAELAVENRGVRIVDDTGEDYLISPEEFETIEETTMSGVYCVAPIKEDLMVFAEHARIRREG